MRIRWRSPRVQWIFWLGIALVLALAWPRLVVHPDTPATRTISPVVISEFQAVAGADAPFLDEDGEPADWIELVNRGDAPVELTDWSLTDDPTRPTQWIFDDTVLGPGEHLMILATGKDRTRIEVDDETGEPGYLHTNFRLAGDGGFLALYPPTARRYLDSTTLDYPRQIPGMSYGRAAAPTRGDDGYGYFAEPTPGMPNVAAVYAGMTEAVAFSRPHGLYDGPITLSLSTPTPAAQIRYTLDGSVPSAENGETYTVPLSIDGTTVVRAVAIRDDYLTGPVGTQSYLFVEDVLRQPADPPGFPPTWGTHRIDFGGYTAGEPVAADYAMDARIVDDPVYGPMARAGLADLPTLSLVTDVGHWDIYADPQARGPEAERPVSVEFIDPSGAEPGFQVDAGLRIQGGAGRWEFMPKHSFRLFFTGDYGPTKLVYPFFPDSPVMEFDTLVLRAGVDRSFAGHPPAPDDPADNPVDHRETVYARDEWVRASQIATSGIGSHGRFVHLYLNGLYWGLYNVVERPDASFMAGYFGGDKDEYGSTNHGGPVSGPQDRFEVLLRLAQEGGLADPAKYATMLEFIDPTHFSDYLLVNWYAGNYDWPENNWYANVHYPAGPNYFFVWDAEATWDDGAALNLGGPGFAGAPYPNVVKLVFDALMENADFRMLFADRLARAVAPDGALADAASEARWQALTDPLANAIAAESARWGDVREEPPITPDDWAAARDDVSQQMAGNGAKLVQLARDAGYYPLLDPPDISPETRILDGPTDVELSAPAGEIYYTLDGSDPRLSGGDIAPGARLYRDPLRLDSATTLRARVREGETWSALRAAVFHGPDEQGEVRITEIMYNPFDGEAYEFVELKNVGVLPVDLSLAFFTGIDFTFPRGTVIEPGEFKVIVADFRRFRERYPDPDIHGVYRGRLSDRGELLALFDVAGNPLSMVPYDDGNGWPLSADQVGDSIVPVDYVSDPARPFHWQASANVNGSPGADDPNTRQ